MGLLASSFLIGLAALGLPLIYHLIRRTPRGRQQFSSLMFLSPTPPQLTRRSRLDQVLLLLMRLAALALLCFAFARPFFREASLLALGDLPQRRVAILLDNSASLRRGDLWSQSLAQVRQELDDLAPHDQVALFVYSDRWETIVGFNDQQRAGSVAPVDIIRERLKDLEPNWRTTDLGTALVALAGELDAASDVQQAQADPQLIVISDFQQGSAISALQAFEWPKSVRVVLRKIEPAKRTNATLTLLASEDDADAEPRVRVSSAADSQSDQFFVRWSNGKSTEKGTGETAVYVPPGQSRVIKLPRPADNLLADRLVLRGDEHEFDNVYYVAPPRPQELTLLYAGNDKPDDPQGLQYYLALASSDDPLRKVAITSLDDTTLGTLSGPLPPTLVVVSHTPSAATLATINTYFAQGGTLVVAPRETKSAELIPTLLTDTTLVEASKRQRDDDFLLLGEIDFGHPLFAPLAGPRYNDFTKVHFWRHTALKLNDDATTRVVARFDDGSPWLLEKRIGQGRILALTSSWQPDDSQLALSSKFVPMIVALLDMTAGSTQPAAGVAVGQSVPLPENRNAALTLQTPDRKNISLPTSQTSFAETTSPGIYQAAELRFAVNLASSESATAPLELEQLEQLGVRVSQSVTRAEELDRLRQAQDTELEGRQNVWRWLLVGCIGFLILETWWSGRAAKASAAATEVVA